MADATNSRVAVSADLPTKTAARLRWSAPVLRAVALRDSQAGSFSLASVDGTSTS